MSRRYEVVVIGGGQAGAVIGYFLAQQARDFTVLEAATEPAAAWRVRYARPPPVCRNGVMRGRRAPPSPLEQADQLPAYRALRVLRRVVVDVVPAGVAADSRGEAGVYLEPVGLDEDASIA